MLLVAKSAGCPIFPSSIFEVALEAVHSSFSVLLQCWRSSVVKGSLNPGNRILIVGKVVVICMAVYLVSPCIAFGCD